MTLDDYQRAAARTMNASLTREERLMDAAAGMAEEAGEVLALVRKHLYQQRALDPARLREELGDALWCLAVAADAAGFTLEEVATSNVDKLAARHPGGFKTR
ncbi:MAG TPA: nucleoside triphosphate pyrophosphohydrolase family protein [Gemmatimonadaceae bacterium]|jgi:NTP pyrophosphatase (non-canonical NTP hydrolase)|nr:nucleoside triphosphate pyrophosphohydrolase family protein [Gemmatimonadaceae bacterium]